MKKIWIIALCFMTSFTIFAQKEAKKLKLEGKTFNLPMTQELAKKVFNLNKLDRNGDINNRKFLAHKKSDSIIGVTSYKRCYKETPEKSVKVLDCPRKQYISELEKKYNSKFKPLNIKNVAFINPDFVYMELKGGKIIVIGTMYYNLMYNTYTTVSFFHGVTVKDLANYLSALY